MTVGLVLGICGYILHCFIVEELCYFAMGDACYVE